MHLDFCVALGILNTVLMALAIISMFRTRKKLKETREISRQTQQLFLKHRW